jgi:uncharacterized protein YqeY
MPVLVERMQADLKAAMRDRDKAAVSVLRTTLAAFANAEAPPMADGGGPNHGRLVEHDRIELTDDDLGRIVREEIADREDTIARFEQGGGAGEADVLRTELTILRRYVD